MNLMIRRTSKCVNYMCKDCWNFIEGLRWPLIIVVSVGSLITCFICIAGAEVINGKTILLPGVSIVLVGAAYLFMASITTAIIIGLSHPYRWVRFCWRESCKAVPIPSKWDGEVN